MILSQGQILGLAQEAGLTGNAAMIASAIAMAESGGDTNTVNPGTTQVPEHSVGLWQINLLAHPQYTESKMLDPLNNALAMFSISNGGKDWTPWTEYRNGKYLQFMTNSVTPVKFTGVGSSGLTGASPGGLSLGLSLNTSKAVLTDTGSGWTYILAYTVAGIIFIFISRFEAGYNALWYLAVLTLLFLLITQSRFIADALAPISTGAPVSV